eukprot:scaffold16652_cov43-Phaeocystis_antarctica.AAC.2
MEQLGRVIQVDHTGRLLELDQAWGRLARPGEGWCRLLAASDARGLARHDGPEATAGVLRIVLRSGA